MDHVDCNGYFDSHDLRGCNDMAHSAKKTGYAGEYLYRGYLLSKHVNENECHTGEWDISEWVEHPGWGSHEGYADWEICDTWSTLRDCKEIIDNWVNNN